MTEPILIRGARILDPGQGMDVIGDVLAKDGKILSAGETIFPDKFPEGCQVVPAAGLVACPGFIDLHCHLREPGFEYKETISTGTRAAARGGVTTVCCIPHTQPAIDK